MRHFSIASAAALIIATVLLAIIWHREASDQAITVAEQQSIHLAELMINALRSGAAPQPDIGFGTLLKENQFNRAYEGSGLGLYLVKSIVELHGGELILDSEPGRGTTVTMWLPIQGVTD